MSNGPYRKPTQTRLAYLDILNGAAALPLWGVLGWHDIRLRYRRSKLGPFWLTISMGVLVGVLGNHIRLTVEREERRLRTVPYPWIHNLGTNVEFSKRSLKRIC